MATQPISLRCEIRDKDHSVVVSAVWMEPYELYSILVKLDGQAMDSFHSDDVWNDMQTAYQQIFDDLALISEVQIDSPIAEIIPIRPTGAG